jgi:beta-lactamase regulating signal transducer with metallopeptidase domain
VDVILNWLAQGGVVSFVAAVVLRVIPRSRTQARYGFVWATCAVVLSLPLVPPIVAATSPVTATDRASMSLGPLVSMPAAWWASTPLVAGLWIMWSGVYAARLAVSAVALRETRRQCRECPSELEARLHHWSRVRVTARRTRLVLSTRVRSAAVLGWGSPVIALAPALLEQLSDADLDRIVLHEWAHVQRRDDIARLVQLLLRAVAGWHPAVWWLDRQLELEREVACDEISVAVTGSAKAYAACLATLAALPSGPGDPVPALAAVSPSDLRRRVVRILAGHQAVSARPWRAMALCASTAPAALALAIGNMQVVESGATWLHLPGVARPPVARTAAAPTPTAAGQMERAASSQRSTSSRRVRSTEDRAIVEPPASALAAVPSEFPEWPPEAATSRSLETPSLEGPIYPLSPVDPSASIAAIPARADEKARTPWAAAAEAGVAIGRGSEKAGVATAGFFTRFGKTVARSF